MLVDGRHADWEPANYHATIIQELREANAQLERELDLQGLELEQALEKVERSLVESCDREVVLRGCHLGVQHFGVERRGTIAVAQETFLEHLTITFLLHLDKSFRRARYVQLILTL